MEYFDSIFNSIFIIKYCEITDHKLYEFCGRLLNFVPAKLFDCDSYENIYFWVYYYYYFSFTENFEHFTSDLGGSPIISSFVRTYISNKLLNHL